MAAKEYVVRSGALTAKLDKEGKQVQRYHRGDTVKLDSTIVDVDNLLKLGAIAEPGSDEAEEALTARGAGEAANQAAGTDAPELGKEGGEVPPSADEPADPTKTDDSAKGKSSK
jgi:hypothetical protein